MFISVILSLVSLATAQTAPDAINIHCATDTYSFYVLGGSLESGAEPTLNANFVLEGDGVPRIFLVGKLSSVLENDQFNIEIQDEDATYLVSLDFVAPESLASTKNQNLLWQATISSASSTPTDLEENANPERVRCQSVRL